MKPRKAMPKARAKEKADKIEAINRGEDVAVPENGAPFGRPTSYKPEYVEQAAKLCDMGATDAEIASFFNVCNATLYNWMKTHTDFLEAIQVSKEAHDNRVERSLYQKAIGYDRTVQKATASGQVVEVKEFYPPDTASAIFWLKNRRSQKWKDRHDVNNTHTVTLSSEFESFMRQVISNKAPQIVDAVEISSSEYRETRPLDFSSPLSESKTIP